MLVHGFVLLVGRVVLPVQAALDAVEGDEATTTLEDEALQIDYAAKTLIADNVTYNEGDFLSINGTLGNVYAGQLPTAASEIVQVLVEKSLDPKKNAFHDTDPACTAAE